MKYAELKAGMVLRVTKSEFAAPQAPEAAPQAPEAEKPTLRPSQEPSAAPESEAEPATPQAPAAPAEHKADPAQPSAETPQPPTTWGVAHQVDLPGSRLRSQKFRAKAKSQLSESAFRR